MWVTLSLMQTIERRSRTPTWGHLLAYVEIKNIDIDLVNEML